MVERRGIVDKANYYASCGNTYYGGGHDDKEVELEIPQCSANINMRRNICFLFAIVAFAATAAGRCPGIPKTHCAALHSDVTCSGWSYKVHKREIAY